MEQMNSRNRLQLIRETTPGVYNAAGERLTMVSLRGDFQPEEAWASFRPDGFNEDAWHALERSHRIWQGSIRWDYRQAALLLRMLCGAPITDEVADGVRTRTFTLPEDGPRNLTGATQTIEYGTPASCERCEYGVLLAISLPAERTSDTVEGTITMLCQKPVASGVPMTGEGAAASDVFSVQFQDVPAAATRVVTFYDEDGAVLGTVTITAGEASATIQTELRALGAPYAAATVTGSTTASAGAEDEVQTITVPDDEGAETHGVVIPDTPLGAGGVVHISSNDSAAWLRTALVLGGNSIVEESNVEVTREVVDDTVVFTVTFVGDLSETNIDPFVPIEGAGSAVVATETEGSAAAGAYDGEYIITPASNLFLPRPTNPDDDVTITRTQAGTSGSPTVPARVPMLNKNFSVRRAADFGDLDEAAPLRKSMMVNFDLGALIEPVWFFNENEETYESHVDGGEPSKTLGLRVAASSSDLAALLAAKAAQPSEPAAYQLRAVHADDSDYSFKAEFFAAISGAANLGAGGNVRYVEFPLAAVIHGGGFSTRFIITEPVAAE